MCSCQQHSSWCNVCAQQQAKLMFILWMRVRASGGEKSDFLYFLCPLLHKTCTHSFCTQECSNPQEYEVISGEKPPHGPPGAIRLGDKALGLWVMELFSLLRLEKGKWENTGLVRAFPCHLSRSLCCPSVIHGHQDGLAKSSDFSSGKAICSLSSVISGKNEMCPQRAQPCLPV